MTRFNYCKANAIDCEYFVNHNEDKLNKCKYEKDCPNKVEIEQKGKIKCDLHISKTFGAICNISSRIPALSDIIIVCSNDGTGLKPLELLLPHQLYLEDINRIIQNDNVKEIVVIPANSKTYITVWKNNENN